MILVKTITTLQWLDKHNPTELGSMVNSLGQTIDFYEDPIRGDEGFVMAIVESEHLVRTSFYEIDDMMQEAPYDDYQLIVEDGEAKCLFESNCNLANQN